MEREPGTPARWRQSVGIVITIAGLIALAAVLFQYARLGSVESLSAEAAARERLALTESHGIFDAIVAAGAYRDAAAFHQGAKAAAAARAQLAAALSSLREDYTKGAAAALEVHAQWQDVETQNKVLAQASEAATPTKSNLLVRALERLLDATQDASGLTYDSDPVAQNLADTALNDTPRAYNIVGLVRMQAVLFVRNGTMALPDRIRLANNLNALRADFDINSDHVPESAASLMRLVNDPRLAAIPQLADEYTKSGDALRAFVNDDFVQATAPAVHETDINKAAAHALDTTRKLYELVTAGLDEQLIRRADAQKTRQNYLYLAYLAGAVVILGFMVLIAQLVARREREALRQAQQESMRLSAELARQEAEEALRLSEAQFRAIFDAAAIGIAIVDRSGSVVESNGVFRAMFDDDVSQALHSHEEELADVFAGRTETFEFEQHLHNPMGQEVWADVTVSMVSGESAGPAYAICMFRDKTQLKHNERRMQYDKLHDALTGLPNRQLFEDQLRRRFEEATALLDSFFAVLFVDLEHFKDVNESLGHAAGDLVLTQVAQRLRTSVDARDVVARLGSDEFAVLIQSLGDILHVESVARRVLNNLSKTIAIGNRSIYLGACVGIAIGSSSYERAEDVMRDAEVAMQHAKIGGGQRYAVFDSKMHQRAQKRLQLTSDIRMAIERSEFRLLYQPIVSLADGTPVGCEALIRWDHPVEGVLNPAEFMPIAEQSSLAIPIGRFVLQTAIEQLSVMRRYSDPSVPFTMHINVSAAELLDPDFERVLVQLVDHHGVPAEDITIEITESVVLDAGTRANITIERVRNRGFCICIDDFGTGYSSLRYLQQFQVDAIKIDRMFVSGSDGELASEPIVRTLMTLAEAFDVRVVAEGVETSRQRDMLRNAGCRLAQGYLYARPISAAEMVATFPKLFTRQQSA